MSRTQEHSSFPQGTLIAGRYEVVGRLGSGGMGLVLQVRDRALENEQIALKMLYPEMSRDKTQFARFRNEVLISRKLAHPNVVRLYDFGAAAKGYYYISMEFASGGSLGQRIYDIETKPLSFPEVVRILFEAAQGLSGAHRQGVVHRDLKPDNILLSESGEVKLTDFGLARSMDVDKGFTNTGETVGTPYYMAPEQLRGEKADQRADIYSLGILAYELATGKRPFVHDDYMTLARMHFVEPVPKFAVSGSGIPKWFERFVEKCCEKDREDRFQTADEVSQSLYERLSIEQKAKYGTIVSSVGRGAPEVFRRAIVRQVVAASVIVLLLFLALTLIRENASLKQEVAGLLFKTRQVTGIDLSALEGAIEGQLTESDFFSSIVLGNKRAVEQLLAAGESASRKDQTGTPALVLAVRAKRPAIATLLLENGADPNASDGKGRTAVMYAATEDVPGSIATLVEYGASIGLRDKEEGATPLILAAKHARLEALSVLLSLGAEVDASDARKKTALHWAVEKDNRFLTQRLLEAGASLKQDASGKTPRDIAKENRAAVLPLLE